MQITVTVNDTREQRESSPFPKTRGRGLILSQNTPELEQNHYDAARIDRNHHLVIAEAFHNSIQSLDQLFHNLDILP